MMDGRWLRVGLVVVAAVVTSCGGPATTASPTPEPTPQNWPDSSQILFGTGYDTSANGPIPMSGISTSFPGSASIVAIGNCGGGYIMNAPYQVTVDGTVVYSGRTEGFVHDGMSTVGGAMGGPIFYVIEPGALPAGPHTVKMIE
jgi:hypothetical protein